MSQKKKQARKSMPGPVIIGTGKWTALWECYWFGPVAAIRPYLLMKAMLPLLALDMWLLRLKNGAKYGVLEFNVAHFPWLDAIQPIPTPELFVGLVLSVGILALVCTFAGAVRWALVLLALGYTYTWAMSMLDLFQHHYFLTLVLFTFLFFPLSHATDLYRYSQPSEGEPQRAAENPNTTKRCVSSWGYRLLGANVAIVYFYTAISKITEPEFLQGDIVKRLTRDNPFFRSFEVWFLDFNIDPDLFYQLAALGVIILQIFLAIAYLLTIRLDEDRSPWLQVVAWFGFIGAVSFHGIGNEFVADMRIGWFSYYMIALACGYFLPASFLWAVGGLMTWPVRSLIELRAKLPATFTEKGVLHMGLMVGGLALGVGSFFLSFHLDLPGGEAVGLLAAFGLAGATIASFFLRRHLEVMKYILVTALAAGFMWVVITQSMVRFEYYQRAGEVKRIQGNLDAAIRDFEKAILYVPTRMKNDHQHTGSGISTNTGRAQDLLAPAP